MELRITAPDETTKTMKGMRPGETTVKVTSMSIEPSFYQEGGDQDVAYLEVLVKDGNKEHSVSRSVLSISCKDGTLKIRRVGRPNATPKFELELLQKLSGDKQEGMEEDDQQEEEEPEESGEPVTTGTPPRPPMPKP